MHNDMWADANKFCPRYPGGQNWRMTNGRTVVGYTIAPTTRQPVSVKLAQDHPNNFRNTSPVRIMLICKYYPLTPHEPCMYLNSN